MVCVGEAVTPHGVSPNSWLMFFLNFDIFLTIFDVFDIDDYEEFCHKLVFHELLGLCRKNNKQVMS